MTSRYWNVWHASGVPLSKPRRSHVTRCSDVPVCEFVREHVPGRHPLNAVVADGRRRLQALLEVAGSISTACAARPDCWWRAPTLRRNSPPGARAGPTVRFAREGFSRLQLAHLDSIPRQRLHVMPELVREHVGLGEVAGRAESAAELVEEPEVEIDVLVARTVERPARATARSRRPIEWRRGTTGASSADSDRRAVAARWPARRP